MPNKKEKLKLWGGLISVRPPFWYFLTILCLKFMQDLAKSLKIKGNCVKMSVNMGEYTQGGLLPI